ncbi:DUF2339 domain-containing protein [Kineococcus sp. NUM-3379]
MTAPDELRQYLAEEFRRLDDGVRALHARLDSLEDAVRPAAPRADPPAPAAVPSPAPTAVLHPPVPAPQAPPQAQPYAPPPRGRREPRPSTGADRERLLSRLFAAVGTVITLVGVTYLVVLGVRHGVFGPVPRTVSLAVLSLGLLAAGARVRTRAGTGAGAVSLAAVGLTGLYLTLVATTAVYGWLHPVPGLLAAVALALAGLEVARRWSSEALGVVAVTAVCALVPFVAGLEGLHLVGAHVLVLALGCARVLRARPRWRTLHVAVLALLWLHTTSAAPLAGLEPRGAVLAVTLAAPVLVWAWALLGSRDPRQDRYLAVAAAVYAVPVFTLVQIQGGDRFVVAVLAPLSVLLAAAALLTGRGRRPAGVAVRTTLWAVAASFVLAMTLHLVAAPYAVAFLLGQALALDALSHVSRTRTAFVTSLAFGLVALTQLLARVLPTDLVDPSALAGTASWPDVLSAVLLVVWVLSTAGALGRLWPAALPVPSVWCPALVLLWYGTAAAAVPAGVLLVPGTDGFLLGHLVTTLGFAAVGFALLGAFLSRARVAALRDAGLVAMGAAVLKVLVDASVLEGIQRVGAYLGVGLALLVLGVRYGRRLSTSQVVEPDSVPDGGPGGDPDAAAGPAPAAVPGRATTAAGGGTA